MVRCDFCKKKTSVALKCNYCTHELCVKCRGIETHQCKGKDEKVNDDLKLLDKKLTYKVNKQHELLCS